mgnify:CR=1 FL=1
MDIIVHLGRLRDKTRKVLEIAEVTGFEDGEITLSPLYAFEEEEKEIPDPFGTCFTGREKWGDEKAAARALHTPFEAVKEDFDWEEDRRPKIPANECIVYKIHPRGFSKHASFKGESWKREHLERSQIRSLI